jgi:hypothetical protein
VDSFWKLFHHTSINDYFILIPSITLIRDSIAMHDRDSLLECRRWLVSIYKELLSHNGEKLCKDYSNLCNYFSLYASLPKHHRIVRPINIDDIFTVGIDCIPPINLRLSILNMFDTTSYVYYRDEDMVEYGVNVQFDLVNLEWYCIKTTLPQCGGAPVMPIHDMINNAVDLKDPTIVDMIEFTDYNPDSMIRYLSSLGSHMTVICNCHFEYHLAQLAGVKNIKIDSGSCRATSTLVQLALENKDKIYKDNRSLIRYLSPRVDTNTTYLDHLIELSCQDDDTALKFSRHLTIKVSIDGYVNIYGSIDKIPKDKFDKISKSIKKLLQNDYFDHWILDYFKCERADTYDICNPIIIHYCNSVGRELSLNDKSYPLANQSYTLDPNHDQFDPHLVMCNYILTASSTKDNDIQNYVKLGDHAPVFFDCKALIDVNSLTSQYMVLYSPIYKWIMKDGVSVKSATNT